MTTYERIDAILAKHDRQCIEEEFLDRHGRPLDFDILMQAMPPDVFGDVVAAYADDPFEQARRLANRGSAVEPQLPDED